MTKQEIYDQIQKLLFQDTSELSVEEFIDLLLDVGAISWYLLEKWRGSWDEKDIDIFLNMKL